MKGTKGNENIAKEEMRKRRYSLEFSSFYRAGRHMLQKAYWLLQFSPSLSETLPHEYDYEYSETQITQIERLRTGVKRDKRDQYVPLISVLGPMR